jgi:hypothetical protein
MPAALRVAMACVSARMLAPVRLELVPITALLPSALCHCTPKLAALVAFTSTISASIITCARRPSSRSITARIWRYCGSGAVMISELVLGSAWICPPVEGWFALFSGAEACGEPLFWPPKAVCCACWAKAFCACGCAAPPAPAGPPWVVLTWLAAMAARSVAARRTASAFFR